MTGRADPFETDFDVDGFTPATPKNKPDPALVRQAAARAGFPSREPETPPAKGRELRFHKVGVVMHPQTIRQFELLKAEQKGPGRKATVGPELLHEAMNLLFEKYGKDAIPLES